MSYTKCSLFTDASYAESDSSEVQFLGGCAAPKRNSELTMAWSKIFVKSAQNPPSKFVLRSETSSIHRCKSSCDLVLDRDDNVSSVIRKRSFSEISTAEKFLRAEGNS